MAKKTPAKKRAAAAARKPARKPVRRRVAPRPARKAVVRTPKKKARKPAKAVKPVKAVKKAKRAKAKKPVARSSARPISKKAAKPTQPRRRAAARKPAAPPPPARLQRERRRLAEAESFAGMSEDSRLVSSARTGHDELRSELRQHTESSPAMTAGDVDAKWQDAYALGDEAPGGDNMTPDQDRVDDIGKALGIEYADDEELMGGDELTERDVHRWELDPASRDDESE